jgi:hypothetical protein
MYQDTRGKENPYPAAADSLDAGDMAGGNCGKRATQVIFSLFSPPVGKGYFDSPIGKPASVHPEFLKNVYFFVKKA